MKSLLDEVSRKGQKHESQPQDWQCHAEKWQRRSILEVNQGSLSSSLPQQNKESANLLQKIIHLCSNYFLTTKVKTELANFLFPLL